MGQSGLEGQGGQEGQNIQKALAFQGGQDFPDGWELIRFSCFESDSHEASEDQDHGRGQDQRGRVRCQPAEMI